MIVYNPLARPVSKILRIPILNSKSVVIVDPEGDKLLFFWLINVSKWSNKFLGVSLNVEYFPIPQEVINIAGRDSDALQEAVFTVNDIPALGFKSFYIQFLDAIA